MHHYNKKLLGILTIFTASIKFSFAQLPPADPGYKLVFHDEFESTHPPYPVNDKLWARNYPWMPKSNFTDNVSWCFSGDTTAKYWDMAYRIRNQKDTTAIKVSNGTCKLLTDKRNYYGEIFISPPCNPAKPGFTLNNKKCKGECVIKGNDSIPRCWTVDTVLFKYTSGMLFSKQKFRRGFFEIRFRLPAPPAEPYSHQGFGPNFWLWGNKPPKNWYGEIDIFEIIAFNNLKNDSNKYTSAVHYSDKQAKPYPKAYTEVLGNKLKNDTSWHKSAAWWTDEFVKFYLDDSLYYTVHGNEKIAVDKLEEMNLIIDVNAPVSGRCNNFDEVYTKFPYVYEIDYVRVYQLQ
ncbi:hypothetical protein BH11BAC1_BH11BAC1_12470 [soil metagenome]